VKRTLGGLFNSKNLGRDGSHCESATLARDSLARGLIRLFFGPGLARSVRPGLLFMAHVRGPFLFGFFHPSAPYEPPSLQLVRRPPLLRRPERGTHSCRSPLPRPHHPPPTHRIPTSSISSSQPTARQPSRARPSPVRRNSQPQPLHLQCTPHRALCQRTKVKFTRSYVMDIWLCL
jgi:hypothetical protein